MRPECNKNVIFSYFISFSTTFYSLGRALAVLKIFLIIFY